MITETQLQEFAQAIKNDFLNDFPGSMVGVDFDHGGRKYIRVIRTGAGSSRSAHSFIEKETGSIWKAASWKTPAKNHPRGNIANLTANLVRWTGSF